MRDEKYITPDECEAYIKQPIVLTPAKPAGLQSFVMNAAVQGSQANPEHQGKRRSCPLVLTVVTNINLKLQHQIEDQLNDKLDEVASVGGEDPYPGLKRARRRRRLLFKAASWWRKWIQAVCGPM